MIRRRYACDFCKKTQDQVEKIILGPDSIAICNECVRQCMEIIEEDIQPAKAMPAAPGTIRPDPGVAVQVERRRFPESGTE